MSASTLQYQTEGSGRNSVDPNYYSSLAKEVYAVGRREKWNDKTIKQMLQDPVRFEKYWSKVSDFFSHPS